MEFYLLQQIFYQNEENIKIRKLKNLINESKPSNYPSRTIYFENKMSEEFDKIFKEIEDTKKINMNSTEKLQNMILKNHDIYTYSGVP